MMRMASPSHPGQFIRMEIIEPSELSVTGAANILGVTRPALSALLNTCASLSPEMALRIEKAFRVKMDTFLRLQTSFEIAEARKREGDVDVQPYVAMTKSYSRSKSVWGANVLCIAMNPDHSELGMR
jgi:antitoxin HigA-1